VTKLVPFANESDALMIGELNIENRLDRVSLYGNIELTRDKAGLALALVLQSLMNDVVLTLQSETLPDVLPAPEIVRVDNPF
jgi:hypothetical protein